MSINTEQRKKFRSIAHHLRPVVIIAEKGITEGVLTELERALKDHELIKIKFAVNDQEARNNLLTDVCQLTSSEPIQKIGKIAVIVRENPKPNPKLSNILRSQSGSI